MRLPRKHRFLPALIALFGMLFMQLAVASYACPGLRAGDASQSMVESVEVSNPMSGCNQLDSEQPALCHAHCQDGSSSLSKHETQAVSPTLVLIATLVHGLEPAMTPALPGAEPSPSLLQRATAPPISIRHCCFRI
jgi:hypothetical protein